MILICNRLFLTNFFDILKNIEFQTQNQRERGKSRMYLTRNIKGTIEIF